MIDRPGLSSSQVRSAVIAPHGMMLTRFAVAIAEVLSPVREPRPWHAAPHRSIRGHASTYPSVNGSRVPPDSSTQTDFVSVYSWTDSTPFSRPTPLAPTPPNGTLGATTR